MGTRCHSLARIQATDQRIPKATARRFSFLVSVVAAQHSPGILINDHPLTGPALVVVMIETAGCRTRAPPERQSFYRTRTGIISTESCTSSPSP